MMRFCCGSAIVLAVFASGVFGSTRRRKNVVCAELPREELEDILGPAFNWRYMSITEPLDAGAKYEDVTKREGIAIPSFYVNDRYVREISEEPAWKHQHHRAVAMREESPGERAKRNAKIRRQWECESKIAWTDLGPDYFPRYLRNVECTSKRCWYGMYTCSPRSFTVKVLKRRRGKCVEALPGTKVGATGLHSDLKELWVWEERAVNFCCDCSSNK